MRRLHHAWLEIIVTLAEVAHVLARRTWFDYWLIACARAEIDAYEAKWGGA